jgi:hypothetical protein
LDVTGEGCGKERLENGDYMARIGILRVRERPVFFQVVER